MLAWRILVVGLLAANILLTSARILAPAPVPEVRDLPPLPDAPRLLQVEEVSLTPGLPGQDQCFTIGPLSTVLQKRRAEDRLRPFVDGMRARETIADRDRGWWVYLPAVASRQDALTQARRLAEQGVEDYYVVTSGDMENTVSLGLYEDQANARQRQARIRSMGFDAQMSVRRESVPRFWVDYVLPDGERSPWRFILRASPGASHFPIPCVPGIYGRGEENGAEEA